MLKSKTVSSGVHGCNIKYLSDPLKRRREERSTGRILAAMPQVATGRKQNNYR